MRIFIFSYVKKDLRLVVFAMAIKLLGSFGELLLPYVLQHLIDNVVPTRNMWLAVAWGPRKAFTESEEICSGNLWNCQDIRWIALVCLL